MLVALVLAVALPWAGRADRSPDVLPAPAAGVAHVAPAATFFSCPAPTGRSATLLIPPQAAITTHGEALTPGDEVAVVGPDGACAGSGTWTEAGLALTVWADDPFTPDTDGLTPGAPLQLSVRDAATGAVATPEVVGFAEGYAPDGGFQVDALYMVASAPTVGTPGTTGQVALLPNVPNPAHTRTTLSFRLPAEATVRLDVYDALGRHVTSAAAGDFAAGDHRVPLDVSALASGVYVYRLQVGTETLQRRFVVAR